MLYTKCVNRKYWSSNSYIFWYKYSLYCGSICNISAPCEPVRGVNCGSRVLFSRIRIVCLVEGSPVWMLLIGAGTKSL